jgi:pyruvate-formate lyase-activating enzyme
MVYRSCNFLEHGLYFRKDSVWNCCNLEGKGCDSELLISNYKGEKIDWQYIIDAKKAKREAFKRGEIPNCCQNCPNCQEKEWIEEDYINLIFLSHFTKCSCNCNYCYTMQDKEYFNNYSEYKILPILEDLKASGYLRFDGRVFIGGGEISEIEESEQIFDFFIKNNQNSYFVQTSGINYSKAIENILLTGRAEVNISVDSSSLKVYKNIKNSDKYETVIENLKKYNNKAIEGSVLASKYLIIPEVNDDINEIDKWFDLCVNIGLKYIIVDVETEYLYKNPKRIPEIIPKMISHIQNRAKENNIILHTYSNAIDLLEGLKSNRFHLLAENPIKKEYFSCEEMLHTINFVPEGIRHCTYITPENAPPTIPVFLNRPVNTDYVLECKHEIEEQRMDGYIQDDCKNCFRACKKVFENQDYISKVIISHRKDCNAHCTFCYNNFDKQTKRTIYKIMPQLEEFKPYFKNGCEMHFGGGEPTIWDEFDDIIDFAIKEDFTGIFLATNGSVYSEKLADAIRHNKANIVFSTDTADAILFEQLKGLNFEQITENIKKYVECDLTGKAITNKYIIIPNINDSENSIRNWVDFNEKLGIKNLALDIEAIFFNTNRHNIDIKYKKLLDFAEQIIAEKGLTCNLYSFASQMKYDENHQQN